MISKEMFVEWKQHSVTELFFQEIEKRIQEVTEELVPTAGIDSSVDRYRSGYIQAYRDILGLTIESYDND